VISVPIKNYNRREKVGTLLFDLVKYLLTLIVLGSVFAKVVNWKQAIAGFLLAMIIFGFAFYITPPEKE
jgi:hypothetical protein